MLQKHTHSRKNKTSLYRNLSIPLYLAKRKRKSELICFVFFLSKNYHRYKKYIQLLWFDFVQELFETFNFLKLPNRFIGMQFDILFPTIRVIFIYKTLFLRISDNDVVGISLSSSTIIIYSPRNLGDCLEVDLFLFQ
jgi:hypothetical protein